VKGKTMSEQIKISATFPVKSKKIYDAWLNGKEHTAMTGSSATASNKIGGKFTAWDKYICGKNLELVPNKRILQAWRSTEFSKDQLDSYLLVKFEEAKNGTKVSIIHSEIPDGTGSSFKKGWKDFYFAPMKKYFDK
jgi:activator of HSP90 ATPase